MAKTERLDNAAPHKLAAGETFESLAKDLGLSWSDLTRFNFGTDQVEVVNRCLDSYVGCRPSTVSKAYVFANRDSVPTVYVPKKPKPVSIRTGEHTTIQVQKPRYPVTIDVETVDADGIPVPVVALVLQPDVGQKNLELTTDGHGYGSLKGVMPGRYRLMVKGKGPAHFWSKPSSPNDFRARLRPRETMPAVLDTLDRRTVTSVIVQDSRLTPEDQKRRAAIAANTTFRRSEYASYRGKDADGSTMEQLRRCFHLCSDNLTLIAGWTENSKVDVRKLIAEVFPDWLVDHCPSMNNGNYYVVVMEPERPVQESEPNVCALTMLDAEGRVLAEFGYRARPATFGLYGAYAQFEDIRRNQFLDIATRSCLLVRSPGTPFGLDDIVTESARWEQAIASQGQKRLLLYYLPSNRHLIQMGLHGGTGFLEDYPKDSTANGRVHRRNIAVLRNMARIYREVYVRQYVKKVEKVDSEMELRVLGPPLEPYEMPIPICASPDQKRDLYHAYDTNQLEAWRAIGAKLDDLAGQKVQGLPFLRFKVKYEYDLKRMKGWRIPEDLRPDVLKLAQSIPATIEVEGNLDVQVVDGLRIVGKGPTWKRYIKTGLDNGEELVNDKFKVWGKASISDIMDLLHPKGPLNSKLADASFGFQFGPARFELNNNGKKKMGWDFGAGRVETEWNPRNAEMSTAFVLQFKGIEKLLKKAGQDQLAGKLKGLEIGIAIGFAGLREETVMNVVSRAPGFFDRRHPLELFHPRTDWNQLSLDEQTWLGKLGWTEDSWNLKYLTKTWSELPSSYGKTARELNNEEKYAIIQLGFRMYEEYGATVVEAQRTYGAEKKETLKGG